jgi:organic hydroperoxide reductase OsmC/OhrA
MQPLKPAPFPHRYTVHLEDRMLMAPPRALIPAGAPPQFGGSDQVWSPEELLVAAVLECLWTTFEAFARRDGLVVRSYSGAGTGVLDRAAGGPAFTSIDLSVDLMVEAGEEARARALLGSAEKHCIISHALCVPVNLSATVWS